MEQRVRIIAEILSYHTSVDGFHSGRPGMDGSRNTG